jgi:hypothetical protein
VLWFLLQSREGVVVLCGTLGTCWHVVTDVHVTKLCAVARELFLAHWCALLSAV